MARRLPEDAGALDDRTYAAWCDLRAHLEAKRARPLTIDNYGWCLVQLADWSRGNADGRAPLDLDHKDLNGYLSWLDKHGGRDGRPGAPATVDTRYRALRRFYGYWLDAGYVEANPMRLVGAPAMPQRMTPVAESDDTAALIKACEGKDHDSRRDLAMIRLALSPGGPRASELCGITVADVDLRGGVVRIEGKGGKDRLVPMGPMARQAMTRYLAERARHKDAKTAAAVFLGKRGPITRSGLQKLLARRCREAGIAVLHPHQLRHTIAARCKAERMDPETAKRLFGWSTDAMYGRYGAAAADALAVEHGREMAAALEL